MASCNVCPACYAEMLPTVEALETSHLIIIIIIVGFIERKIDTNPLMRLSARRDSTRVSLFMSRKT